MFSIRDNVFFNKNAISKNIAEKISYLPKVGYKIYMKILMDE